MSTATTARAGATLRAARLARAVQRREVFLHYQPVATLADRRLAGVEALARWRHPTLGAVSPRDFVPLAEDTGLIVHLTQAVLEMALDDMAAGWIDSRWWMAVNLSPVMLEDPGLVVRVDHMLQSRGLAPGRLKLEVTEGLGPPDSPQAVATMHALRALGVQLILDDFGTGFASFEQVRRFPYAGVKIDRAFVSGALHDRGARAVVHAAVALGRERGLDVVAEGVESWPLVDWLGEAGCDAVQGYYVGRPAGIHEIPCRVRRWTRLTRPEATPRRGAGPRTGTS